MIKDRGAAGRQDRGMRPPHSAGDHALLGDGRTAALVDPEGGVAWLCWPRFDSSPCLLSILDPRRGGRFRVAPVRGRVVERRYLPGSLVSRTVWETSTGRLVVDEALTWDAPQRLVRQLVAEGSAAEVEVAFEPAFAAATSAAQVAVSGAVCEASGGGTSVAVAAPTEWRGDDRGAAATFRLPPGPPVAVVLAGTAAEARRGSDLGPTLAHGRALEAAVDTSGLAGGGMAARALGEAGAAQLIRRSALVLEALSWRGGGMVAAPTTSLPQWPGSSRTWDYRFCWPRDTALAALALLRCGQIEQAAALGDFLGRVSATGDPPPLVRVDGSRAPAEIELDHLAGHGGARPVRLGNAAAVQVQVDVLGELLDLADALDRAGALPDSLRRAAPRLADAAQTRWAEPDHGIWEIRGERRVHTHSQVMAWTGLRRAAAMQRRGTLHGDSSAWERTAVRIRGAVLHSALDADGGLSVDAGDGGPDAALALVPLVGFLGPRDPIVHATLDNISRGLDHDRLLDRYLGQPDGIADPTAPFVFPTLWLAAALDRCGRDGAPRLAVAAATRSPFDLLAECALDGRPQGNLPQAQSHAALIMACLPSRRPG